MSKIDWRRAQHPGRQRVSVSDEAEHLGKDRAARWLEKQPHTHPTPQRTPVKADPMSYQQSTRITALFSNTAKSGGTYYSGKLGEAVTIPAGARITLVRSTKTASNGSEIWSLLFDEPGSGDQRRVFETRGDVDLDNFRGRAPLLPVTDEIPF
jgi:hypothetical protein